jgi:hypothetical protein
MTSLQSFNENGGHAEDKPFIKRQLMHQERSSMARKVTPIVFFRSNFSKNEELIPYFVLLMAIISNSKVAASLKALLPNIVRTLAGRVLWLVGFQSQNANVSQWS